MIIKFDKIGIFGLDQIMFVCLFQPSLFIYFLNNWDTFLLISFLLIFFHIILGRTKLEVFLEEIFLFFIAPYPNLLLVFGDYF